MNVLPEKDGIAVFLIRLCAVIGGLYTLANFLANWLLSVHKPAGYELVKWDDLYFVCLRKNFDLVYR